jgi:hypothetical protein
MALNAKPPNAEQLRKAIDSGQTGDKVRASDPAVAPLTTDDEAAGKPPSPGALTQAYPSETNRPNHEQEQRGPGHAWILIVFVLIAAIMIIAAGMLFRPAG